MLPWQDIETVLLDMDGTLLDLHYDNDFWLNILPSVYAEKNQLPLEETRVMLADNFRSTLGTLEFYCIDYWSERLDLDVAALKAQHTDNIRYLPHAEEFLAALTRLPSKPRVILATNAHRKVYEIKNQKLGIDAQLDAVFCANELGAPKESSEYWHNLQKLFPFSPRTSLLVDDNQNVLRTAKDYGIASLVMPLLPDSKKSAQMHRNEFKAIQSLAEIFPLHDTE